MFFKRTFIVALEKKVDNSVDNFSMYNIFNRVAKKPHALPD